MTSSARFLVLLAMTVCVGAAGAMAGEAPATMTVDEALAALKTFDHSQSRRPLAVLELAVERSGGDPARGREMAARLAAVLADPQATDAARDFVLRYLPLVATDAEVPLLVKCLGNPKTADAARRALEATPGEASAAALRAALVTQQGTDLVGVVNSLGARRDEKAVPDIAKWLSSADAAVAEAAARALGRIGTTDAAAALAQAPQRIGPVVRDARVRCAEGLLARGDTAGADAIYRQVLAANPPAVWRVTALAGLTKAAGEKALPALMEAVGAGEPLVRATALRLTRELPGAAATAALVRKLAEADAMTKVLILDVLAERGDRAAGGAVAKGLDEKDDAVRAAAARAMATLGDAACVDALVRLAATDKGPVQQAARRSLERLTGAEVDTRLSASAEKGDAAVRVESLRALGARRAGAAAEVLLKCAADGDASVRQAAWEALAAAAPAEAYPKLVTLLVAAGADARPAEQAVLAVGGRLAGPAERAGPVLAALKSAPTAAKPSLLRVLGGIGGAEALAAVRGGAAAGDDATVRDAAVRALANWPDAAAAADLLAIAAKSDSATHRGLALRGYLRLAREAPDGGARLKMLQQVRPIATTTEAKKSLLAGLADVSDAAALDIVLSFVTEKEVAAEAAAAALKIGGALVRSDRAAVQAAMRKLAESVDDKAVKDQAEAIRAQAAKGAGPAGSANVPAYDKARSDAAKKELAKRAPKGFRLACYLDCGPDTEDSAKDGPALRQTAGSVHLWAGADGPNVLRFGTVAFDGREVIFAASGLDPKREYRLGFSWWDFDHDTRTESVHLATGKGEREVKVLDATRLPSGVAGKPAEERTVPVPRDLSAGGTLRILFRNESAPNAVVSEVWLWESEAESAPPAVPAAPAAEAEKPVARPQAVTTPPGATKVLVLTGDDYPGHKWQETAPVLAAALGKDARLAVWRVDDPRFLADPSLKDYRVVVLHWMNWQKPDPGEAARENLRRFVDGGGGFVLVHFACGAFQGWPEFARIAGRAYDPKVRGHDPFGTFRVEITAPTHPIMQGMQAFETPDELYTCLAGDAPIEVLATARSKVDGKDYPMAFVLTYGKGRVFHSVLGHDVKAFGPPVAELYRRATAWAAGLEPVAKP